MKCLQCGATMKTAKEVHLYDRGGVRASLRGVPVHRCPSCGSFEVEIPRIEDLSRVLAGAIIRKPARLAAAEIRFLRKTLGWSGVDFARHVGVDPSTVSRWETGAQDMGQAAERLLRLMVKIGTPIDDYTLNDLAALPLEGNAAAVESPPFRLRRSTRGWATETTEERV